jgi:hypothetical protein
MEHDTSNRLELDITHDLSKYAELEINSQNVKIPNWFNINAEIEYFESYKKDKNYRRAFCNLVFIMLDRKKDSSDTNSINLENIESISDDDLIKIMEIYLSNHEELNSYFKENFKEDYFEAFYLALKKQEDKLAEQISNSMGLVNKQIGNSIKPILNSISNMVALTNSVATSATYKAIENLHKMDSIPGSSIGEDFLPHIKPPQFETNKLLLELNKNIEKLQDTQSLYQTQNNEYSQKMVEILIKEHDSNEKNAVKNNIIIIVAILTLIATCAGIYFSLQK